MIDKLKKFYYKFMNHDLPLKKRLFNLIFSAAFAVSVGGVIGSIATGTDIVGILVIALIALLIFVCLVIANRFNRFTECAAVIAVFVNLLLLPIVFFWSGGIESGMNIWFVAGIVYLFLMLEGRIFYILTGLSVLSFSMCYLVSYRHPEYVHYLINRRDQFLDTYVTMMMIAIMLGVLLKFQNMIYREERETIRRQQIALEEANETKSRFLANMSHEIRTPINTIIGLNEMNLREEISAEVEENCVNIQRASKILLSLINDILDLSKIESGKMEIIERQYETGAMLSELVNFHWIRAHEKNLEFLLDISPDIPSMLYGDDMRIRQVLTNLITNAIKYTRKGSVTLHVSCERIGNNKVRLKYAVTDTGIGIRKENIQYLFDSFKRVDEKTNLAIEGTGLGLSISHQLVNLMGGQLTVDSVYQRGSTFTVILEQRIVHDIPMGDMEHFMRKSGAGRHVYHQSFEAPEGRVLVVDDNEMNRMVAVKLLRATKLKVDTAASGAECLKMTKEHFYHIIFMDHMMPQMDGIETLKNLRRQENGLCRESIVVALTANAISGADKVYERNGFDGYLVKPINSILLEAMILKFLPEDIVKYVNTGEIPGREPEVREVAKKKRLHITTESVCDLPEEFVRRYDIGLINYYVLLEGGKFKDEIEISSRNLLEYLEQKKRAVSSAPSVEEYETFFADALDHSQQVIHISMGKEAGLGFARAQKASRGFDNVIVVDSGQLSSGMGMLALLAANLAEQGVETDEILRRIESAKKRISTTFVSQDLDYMLRGDRINKNFKRFCDFFGFHPMFMMKKSCIVCRTILSGDGDRLYRNYVRRQMKGRKHIDHTILFVTYAGCTKSQRRKLIAEVEKHQKFDTIIEQPVSAAICCNGGPGAFGIHFITEEKETEL